MRACKCVFLLLIACFIIMGCTSLVAIAAEADVEGESVFEQLVPSETSAQGYVLIESVTIEDNETPLANAEFIEETCCVFHLFLLLCALAVAMYYSHDQKQRQQREFEIRRELGR